MSPELINIAVLFGHTLWIIIRSKTTYQITRCCLFVQTQQLNLNKLLESVIEPSLHA